jgi:hypothetical protein
MMMLPQAPRVENEEKKKFPSRNNCNYFFSSYLLLQYCFISVAIAVTVVVYYYYEKRYSEWKHNL